MYACAVIDLDSQRRQLSTGINPVASRGHTATPVRPPVRHGYGGRPALALARQRLQAGRGGGGGRRGELCLDDDGVGGGIDGGAFGRGYTSDTSPSGRPRGDRQVG